MQQITGTQHHRPHTTHATYIHSSSPLHGSWDSVDECKEDGGLLAQDDDGQKYVMTARPALESRTRMIRTRLQGFWRNGARRLSRMAALLRQSPTSSLYSLRVRWWPAECTPRTSIAHRWALVRRVACGGPCADTQGDVVLSSGSLHQAGSFTISLHSPPNSPCNIRDLAGTRELH